MLRQVIAATAVLVVANCSNAFAQIAGDGEPHGQSEWHHHPSPEDIKAFTDARIAALKAGLQLTPDQEKNWPPFEQAIRGSGQAADGTNGGSRRRHGTAQQSV
jgi:zinc resistance-associated protein